MSESFHDDTKWGWEEPEEHEGVFIPDNPPIMDADEGELYTPIADKLGEYGITKKRVLGGTAAGLMLLGIGIGIRHLANKKEE